MVCCWAPVVNSLWLCAGRDDYIYNPENQEMFVLKFNGLSDKQMPECRIFFQYSVRETRLPCSSQINQEPFFSPIS